MTKRRHITLVPFGGLANRMKAIDSTIGLAAATGAEAEIIWFRDSGLNCGFEDLFKPLSIDGIEMREATVGDYILNDRPRKKNLRIPRLFQAIKFAGCIYGADVLRRMERGFDFSAWVKDRKNVFLTSCYDHFKGNGFSDLQPIDSISEIIDERSKEFNHATIGVHIRRTDHALCISNTPTSLYISEMEKAIANDPATNFYLASDSDEEKGKLTAHFGSRIITSEKTADRNSVDGMREGLAEMMLLSRTSRIIGSTFSSYSQVASRISCIPYTQLSL